MNTPCNRLKRWMAPAMLGLSLSLSPAFSPPVCAQEPAEEKSEGRPLDGYLATGTLVLLALFLVGKSARR